MKPDIEELRKKYIENPPEGMTSRDIRHMSEEELLDMDYFLNDDELDDDFGEEGFYVYAKPNKCDPETVLKYIGRYLGRPVIATSRIDSYDEDSETVTFHYNRHEDDKYIQETIPALDFIRRLIRHIPEKHFKMIRYGGLYARHREIDKNLHLAISKAKRHTLRDFNKWRTAILSSFGYDPLKCPDCKHEMLFLELYFNHKRVSLEEMYEKIMSKARRRWSSA